MFGGTNRIAHIVQAIEKGNCIKFTLVVFCTARFVSDSG